MNEKSKAFELIEFVWNNEKTDSYLRVNIAMYEAVKLAINAFDNPELMKEGVQP